MLNSNFFRMPKTPGPAANASGGGGYSFIDDLLGGIRQTTDDMTAYKNQQQALHMQLAEMAHGASPEVHAALKQMYPDLVGTIIPDRHASSLQFPVEYEDAPQPSANPQQIQAAGSALMGRPPMPLPLGNAAPMPMAPIQQPSLPPPSPTLQVAAGAAPQASLSNPFARLPGVISETTKANDTLANRANPTLDRGQQLAMEKLTGKKTKTRMDLVDESQDSLAGRGYVREQEMAKAKLNQTLEKMDIGEIMTLIKAAAGVNKDTSTTGTILKNQAGAAIGEANALQKPGNAALLAGERSAGKGRDQWLDSMKVKISEESKELSRLQAIKEPQLLLSKQAKTDSQARRSRIAELQASIAARKDAISTKFPE